MTPEELPPPTVDPDEARQAADEILSRPQFQPPPETLYDRVMGFLADRLSDVLSALTGGGRGSLISWLITLAVASVLAVLVYRLVRSVAPGMGRLVGVPGADVAIEDRQSAADWEAAAVAAEARGDWSETLRCRHRALVARMAEAGWLDEVPGRTAREYRDEVARRYPVVADPFSDVTDVFEAAWYGNRPAGKSEAERVRQLSGAVAREVEAGADR